jgi:hypothetical protein
MPAPAETPLPHVAQRASEHDPPRANWWPVPRSTALASLRDEHAYHDPFSPPEMYETTLSFKELEQWLQARLNDSFSIQIATAGDIPAFLEGPVDTVMEFEATASHGLIVEGAAGAWTFHLAEPEFLSAALRPIPNTLTVEQLQIRMRDHTIVIEPGTIESPEVRGPGGHD